jgi:DNA-directed RNA polymerase specialized sigma24 family protein
MCRHIATDSSLRAYAKRLLPSAHNDLLQHLALEVCELTEAKREQIRPYFNFWCVRTMTNMASPRGRVGRLHLAHPSTELPDIADQEPEPLPDIVPTIDNLYWYDRELIKLRAELGSTTKVAERLGVPRRSLDAEIRRIKTIIRNELARDH